MPPPTYKPPGGFLNEFTVTLPPDPRMDEPVLLYSVPSSTQTAQRSNASRAQEFCQSGYQSASSSSQSQTPLLVDFSKPLTAKEIKEVDRMNVAFQIRWATATAIGIPIPQHERFGVPDDVILFTSDARAGVSLDGFRRGIEKLDNACDCPLAKFSWTRTIFGLDWPGVLQRGKSWGEYIPVRESNGGHMRRATLFLKVVAMVEQLFDDVAAGRIIQETERLPLVYRHILNLRICNFKMLRLCALAYYAPHWVPIMTYEAGSEVLTPAYMEELRREQARLARQTERLVLAQIQQARAKVPLPPMPRPVNTPQNPYAEQSGQFWVDNYRPDQSRDNQPAFHESLYPHQSEYGFVPLDVPAQLATARNRREAAEAVSSIDPSSDFNFTVTGDSNQPAAASSSSYFTLDPLPPMGSEMETAVAAAMTYPVQQDPHGLFVQQPASNLYQMPSPQYY